MNIMNSNCSIPNWNLIQQRQVQAQEQGDNHVASMPDDRMRGFIWEQPPEFRFGGTSSSRSRGGFNNNNMATTSCDDTLESIVDQAIKKGYYHHNQNNITELVQNEPVWAELLLMKKRVKSSSSSFSESKDEKYPSCSIGNTKKMEHDHREEVAERSTCDTTTTMIHNVKTTEDSATCHAASENLDKENQRKEETGRSHQTRSSRAAVIHKQSERKRRDRINQKMKALQKLVPNACKTDKASMLDEVIEYMKQLKAQVNLMMNSRNVHDQMLMMMMMPSLGMQQQLQMSSLLARMSTSTTSAPLPPLPPRHLHQSFIPFLHPGMMTSREVPPAVAPPPIIDTPRILNGSSWRANLAAAAISNALPYNEYYSRFVAQSMNMDLYNNMRALCTHQEADISQKTSSHQEVNHVQRQL